MSDTSATLVRMANQIALNFMALGHDHAVEATADHIQMFWDPRMKAKAFDLIAAGEGDFSEPARTALERLARGHDPASQTPATVFNDANEGGGSDAG